MSLETANFSAESIEKRPRMTLSGSLKLLFSDVAGPIGRFRSSCADARGNPLIGCLNPIPFEGIDLCFGI
jgi:hypothetical protein